MKSAFSLALIVCLVGLALPVTAQEQSVRKLVPGTEIIVTVRGSPPAQRDVVAGDEVDLTVLKVADPTLLRAARWPWRT